MDDHTTPTTTQSDAELLTEFAVDVLGAPAELLPPAALTPPAAPRPTLSAERKR